MKRKVSVPFSPQEVADALISYHRDRLDKLGFSTKREPESEVDIFVQGHQLTISWRNK